MEADILLGELACGSMRMKPDRAWVVFSDGVQEFIYEEGLTKASRKWSYRRVMYARMEYLKERLLHFRSCEKFRNEEGYALRTH